MWSRLECYCCQTRIKSVFYSTAHLIEQLQVGNWHFAFLITPLTHEPIRVHAWYAGHGDHLLRKHMHKHSHEKQRLTCLHWVKQIFTHLIGEQREFTATVGIVVVQHTGLTCTGGAAEFIKCRWGLAGWRCWKRGGRRCGRNWDTGGGIPTRLIVIRAECRREAGRQDKVCIGLVG